MGKVGLYSLLFYFVSYFWYLNEIYSKIIEDYEYAKAKLIELEIIK